MRFGIEFFSLRKNAIPVRLETSTVVRFGVLQSGIVPFGSQGRAFKNVGSTFGTSKIRILRTFSKGSPRVRKYSKI